MRIFYFLFICFISTIAQAQDFSVKEIAAMEANSHSRIPLGESQSFASENFDVTYYRCVWKVDPAIRYINGIVTVYFKVLNSTSSITLDLMAPLKTDSVTRKGNQLTYVQSANTLQINFSPAIAAGTIDSVNIFYQGVPAATGFGSFIQDMHSGTPVMWSLSEPYGARDWWPCKNGLNDKADSIDIIIIHPDIYKSASNGLLQSETALSGNFVATHWKHRYPIASYLICFAVTNYVVFNNSVQLGNVNLPMQTYCYPESQAAFQANTFKVLNAMKFFNARFGDYPFIKEKYGHVQFGWGGGMEHQTATFVINTNESLMAHELGHQWFGDKVTTHSWQDIWLNEGFATYLAALYMEDTYPSSALPNRKNIIANITSLPGGAVKVNDTLDVNRIFDGRLSYNKGSYLAYMLRFVMGDEVFFRAINNYLKDPALAYGFVKTGDLKKHMEQASGKDLTQFFKQWYEGEGYPSYNVQWGQLGASFVKIKMNQVTSHASVPFFQMPVALKFKNATQEKTIIVNNTTNGQDFTSYIGFVADTVLVDPDYVIISKNNTTQKNIETNNGQGGMDIFPNPVADPMQIVLHDFNAGAAYLTITNASGQVMYHRSVALTNGFEMLNISTGSWAHGMYVIQVKAGDKKLLKQVLR